MVAPLTVKLAVEMESAELLRDIIDFLNRVIDASGPIDGTADALSLRSRLDTAVENGTLRIVTGDGQEAPVTASPDTLPCGCTGKCHIQAVQDAPTPDSNNLF